MGYAGAVSQVIKKQTFYEQGVTLNEQPYPGLLSISLRMVP